MNDFTEDCFTATFGRTRGSLRAPTICCVTFAPLLILDIEGATLLDVHWQWDETLQGEIAGEELQIIEDTDACRTACQYVDDEIAPALDLALTSFACSQPRREDRERTAVVIAPKARSIFTPSTKNCYQPAIPLTSTRKQSLRVCAHI
jgi:hypothetical protein